MDTSDLPDASPATGIVWAYHFRPDGTAELVSNDKIDAALKANDIGWLWVHLALPDTGCRAWIAQRAPVSEFARDVLAGPDRCLRLDIVGNEIVGVLPGLQQEFAEPGEDFVRLRFGLLLHIAAAASILNAAELFVMRRMAWTKNPRAKTTGLPGLRRNSRTHSTNIMSWSSLSRRYRKRSAEFMLNPTHRRSSGGNIFATCCSSRPS